MGTNLKRLKCCLKNTASQNTQRDWKKDVERILKMCEECRHHPCDARCPNAAEPPIIGYCNDCGGEIYAGEEALKFEDILLCESCIKSDTREMEVESYDEY